MRETWEFGRRMKPHVHMYKFIQQQVKIEIVQYQQDLVRTAQLQGGG